MENKKMGKSKIITDTSSVHKGPSFCKVNFEQDGTLLKIRIPPDFMKNEGSKLRRLRYVNLVGPCGDQKVRFHHEDHTYFHEQGWGEFRRIHSLGISDLLIFEYDGTRTFNVSIYEGSSRIMRSYDEIGSLSRRMSCPQTHGEKRKARGSTGIAIEMVKIEEEDSKDGIVSKEKEQAREERAFNFPSRNNPFSTICIKNYYVKTTFLLRFPKSFSQYFPEERRAKMVLKNSEGKEWLVNAVKNNNIWAFSGGWKSFAKDNKLKEGDTCTFELVRPNMVHVHIYRCG